MALKFKASLEYAVSARLAQAILWACRNKTKEKEEKGEEEKEKKLRGENF